MRGLIKTIEINSSNELCEVDGVAAGAAVAVCVLPGRPEPTNTLVRVRGEISGEVEGADAA